MKTLRTQLNAHRILIGSIAAFVIAAQPAVQAAVVLSTGSGTYTQTFDTLATTGTTNTWADDTTITGWYAAKSKPTGSPNVTVYQAGAGTSTTGALYSFGTGTNSDRALGSLGSGTPGNFSFGVLFQNTSGSNLSLDAFSFFGEQWRNGGVATAQTMSLTYMISSSPITAFDASAATPVGWTNLSSFNFTSPIATITAGALDGNAVANRTLKTGTLGITLPSSQYIAFRWFDADDAGADHGLSLDDLSLAYSSGVAALYWDANGSTAGIGGSGTWDTTTSNWTTAVAGNIATTVFTAANPVTFGGTAGTVTVDAGGVTANGGIQFDTEGYTVSGGTLTLGSAAITTAHATGTTTVNSIIAGSVGLQKLGAGALELGANNTFTGAVAINAGTLKISSDANLGAVANAVQLGGGKLEATASLALDAARSVTGSGTLVVGAGQTLTVPGTMNASGITLEGTGTLALTGATPTITTLTMAGAGTVSSTNTITNTAVTSTNTTGTATVSAALDFGATSRTITVANGSAAVDLLLSGALAMTGTSSRLAKLGDGALELTGTNAISGLRIGAAGTTSANGGTVIIHDADDLGGNQLQFNAGTLTNAGSAITTTVGISIGAGQIGNGATFTGSAMTFQGPSSLFKGTGSTYQHKITANTDVTFAGDVTGGLNVSSGSGTSTGLTIAGTGTVSLPNALNTITENITVDGGNLEISGALTGTTIPSITTQNLGILKGNSTGARLGAVIAGANGLVDPGTLVDSTGTLSIGNFTVQATGGLNLDLGGTTAGSFDSLNVTGTVTLSGTLITALTGGYIPSGMDALTVILNDGTGDAVSGTFTGLPEGSAVGATGLYITYVGGDGNDVVLTTVPEPTSAVLMLSGLGLLGARRRRR